MSSSSSSAEVRAWRAAFLTLRDETLTPPSPPAALRLLRALLFHCDALAAASSHLPPHEVSSDLTLLLEVASSLDAECPGADDAFVSICRFIYALNYKVRLEVNSSSWTLFLNFVEKMISCLLGEVERRKLLFKDSIWIESIMETTEVLRYFMMVHGKNCSLLDSTHLVKVLLCIISCLPMELVVNTRPDIHSHNITDIALKVQLFSLTGISDTFAKIGTFLPLHLWQCAIESLRKVMDAFTSKNLLVESLAMSRFYAACLQCLHLVLSAPKASFSEHVSGFVAALQKFLTYGLNSRPSLPTANAVIKTSSCSSSMKPSSGGSRTLDGVYRPPHLRKREVHQEQNAQISSSNDSLKYGLISSDSEQSDSDGSAKDDDRFRSSKARIAALSCIQDICQVDPKSLTSLLTILLPTNDVLQPRKNQATIMTSLLFDPIMKVRISSASTLVSIVEGHSQVFWQVSEYKESTMRGSFTTLSSSLGQMLLQVHKGIIHLIQCENHGGFLASLFKVLMLLISATPYSRMPDELLPSVIVSVRTRIAKELSASKSDLNIMASAFSCMASGFSTSPPSLHVLEMLKKEVHTGFTYTQGNPGVLDMVLQCSQGNFHPNVRFEALKVLQAIAHNYSYVTNYLWEPIFTAILEILRKPILEDSSFNAASNARRGETRNSVTSCSDKCKIAAIKSHINMDRLVREGAKDGRIRIALWSKGLKIQALDGCLRASSGFKGVDDYSECKLVDIQCTVDCMREIKVSSAPLYVLDCSETPNGSSSEYSNGSKHWLEALDMHVPLILKHNSPAIRAATLTCFAGLTSTVYFSLREDKQNFIRSCVVGAALNDEVPSVRSAGCRALGVLSSFSQILSSKRILDEFIHAADTSSHDPSLSVRITASWALANICDSLRHREIDLHLEVADRSIDSKSISLLVESALRLTLDSDKVKANAVRALGNLSRFVKFTEYFCSPNVVNSSGDGLHWLERMVQAFVSCVTTGNVKVQWNVCYSLGNLFLNPTVNLQVASWSSSVFTILMLLLRDSTNFKIRIHAAVALAVPSSRLDYGSSFSNIVQSIVLVLETFDTDQGLVLSNAKYREALEKQLAWTTLHALGYCSSGDNHTLKSFFVKKASFLEEWFKSFRSKFFKSPEKDLEELDRKEKSAISEPLKAKLPIAIRSLVVVYRCSNNHIIASRFEKLLDGLP